MIAEPNDVITICGDVANRGEFSIDADDVLQRMCFAAGVTVYDKTSVAKAPFAEAVTSSNFRTVFYETVKVGKKKTVVPNGALCTYYNQLKHELWNTRPNVVVAAGNEALFALTGVAGVENYRGSVLESTLVPGLKVIPIIHPAEITRTQRWWLYYVGITDLKRAKQEAKFREVQRPQYETHIWPTFDEIIDWLRVAGRSDQRWCLDLEIRGGSIACIGVGRGSNRTDISAFCIPIQTTRGPAWIAREEASIWQELAACFRRNPNLVGQNIFSFDMDWLLDRGVEPSGVLMDTMSAFAFCYPEFPKSLQFINSIYGSLPYYKLESKTWKVGFPDDQLYVYNLKDIYSTLECSWEIERDLKEANLWQLYQDYCIPVHWAALEIQKRRVCVDVAEQSRTRLIVLNELERVAIARREMLMKYEPRFAVAGLVSGTKKKSIPITAETFNVGSPKQMQTLIFDVMKLPKRHTRGTTKLTTREDALSDLVAYYPERTTELKLLMSEKHLNKALDYVDYKLDPDGMLACQINFPGTKSFRFSMSQSPQGYGFNGQTPPRWSRGQYVPPVGEIFISRDLAQVEARVVAALARCTRQLTKFADPSWSIHKELGRDIYGHEPAKDTPEYTAAKGGIHGGNFREGPLRLARSTGVSFKNAKFAIDGYHKKYPEIRLWHQAVRQQIYKKGQFVNPFGFRRVMFNARGQLELKGFLDEKSWNEACNIIPQSVPPFIINRAICLATAEAPWIHFCHQNHDSYLASVEIGRAVEADALMREFLDVEMMIEGTALKIPSEALVGFSWGEMMPLAGREPTWDEWMLWRTNENLVGRGLCSEAILKGVYGILYLTE